MPKTIYLVSKTHLDLGFTDLAENIRRRYIDDFIPKAIRIAEKLNSDGKKKFVWTTGSWIIKEALEHGTPEQQAALTAALKRGDITAHALPFTTHTELLDADTFRYGISIIKKLDKISGRTTVAAKMTDVPGHTAAIVPYLYENGIRLLHIGVNEASAVPKVPETFLWKYGGGEVVVIYSANYGGGLYKNDLIEEKLYFAHTGDNHGPVSEENAIANYARLQKDYPDHEIVASGLDAIANKLWAVRDKLPVVTSEIGDTWIHGSASDPYKYGAMRELIALKSKWLTDGTLKRGTPEYDSLADNILCLAEHTCGKDVKRWLSDYTHYLKDDFAKARAKDMAKLGPTDIFKCFPHNLTTLALRLKGEYNKGSYSAMEESWKEQRAYIDMALEQMAPKHKKEAQTRLAKLMPKEPPAIQGGELAIGKDYTFRSYTISVNRMGALSLSYKNTPILDARKGDRPAVDYVSYGKKDIDFFKENYMRNLDRNGFWAIPDFLYPGIERVDGRYPTGRFPYQLAASGIQKDEEKLTISLCLESHKEVYKQLGAPRKIYITYEVTEKKVKIYLAFFGKDANRLPEALFMRLYPAIEGNTLKYIKVGNPVNPFDVVERGNRNISAVESVRYMTKAGEVKIRNRHAPLVSLGAGKIYEFDNKYAGAKGGGISFILHDNIWKTNFPLWYEGNGYYETEISVL